MLHLTTRVLIAVGAVCLFAAADWSQFRGENNSGVAVDSKLPTKLNADRAAWKVDLPGRGASSPIVVSGRVIVTASTGFRHDRLHVLCYDGDTGKKLWHRSFWATGRTATHESISCAAPTPASDGELVYAFFSSNDLICLDLDGNLRWFRGLTYDYPKAGNDIGMASSPAVADGVVVVQLENQGDSFAAGIDGQTGETLWRVPRTRKANWCSPVILPGEGGRKTSVLLQSVDQLTAHDLRTGEVLWQRDAECPGVPSSLFRDGWLFAPADGLTAFRFSEDSNSPEVVWDSNQLKPGSASPIVFNGRIYTLGNSIVRCGDVKTGEVLWRLRIKGRHWATPVVAGDHLYCVNQDGVFHVIGGLDGDEGKIVDTAEFGDTVHGTPAISGNAMYLRSEKHLWKIAND